MNSRIFWLLLAALFCIGAQAQSSQPHLVNASPTYIDFGAIKVGSSAEVIRTIKNLSASPVTLVGGGFQNGTLGFQCFACSPLPIPVGGSCASICKFQPKSNDGVVLVDSGNTLANSGTSTQISPLTVSGSGIGTLAHVGPTTIDFGEWLLGSSVSVDVNIVNNSSSAISYVGGGVAGSSGITSFGGNCSPSLAVGGSCFFNFVFTPNQLGAVSASTSISVSNGSSGASEGYNFALSGTGINTPRIAGIRPVAMDFGKVMLGERMHVNIQASNLGASTLNIAGGGFSGSTPFVSAQLLGAGCTSSTIASNTTCTAAYSFRPLTLGAHSNSTGLQFSAGANSIFIPISVSGTGVGKIALVVPELMDFGSVKVGTQMSAAVTITNTTWRPLTNFQGGNVSSPFSMTHNCPSSLAVGLSCQYTYTFSPNSFSPESNDTLTAISFVNDAGAQPVYQITLMGTANHNLFKDGFEN